MPETLSKQDRKKIESFNRVGEDMTLGEVVIDQEKCNGCGLCVGACAAAVLELSKDKKARMVDVLPICMSCGDCVAICPEDAVKMTRYIQFHKAFRYLDRGEPLPPRRF